MPEEAKSHRPKEESQRWRTRIEEILKRNDRLYKTVKNLQRQNTSLEIAMLKRDKKILAYVLSEQECKEQIRGFEQRVDSMRNQIYDMQKQIEELEELAARPTAVA